MLEVEHTVIVNLIYLKNLLKIIKCIVNRMECVDVQKTMKKKRE